MIVEQDNAAVFELTIAISRLQRFITHPPATQGVALGYYISRLWRWQLSFHTGSTALGSVVPPLSVLW